MKLRFLFTASASVMAFTGSVPASAALLLFDFSGPSGTATFQLNSNPTPDFASTLLGSDQFGFNNVAGTFGGTPGTASTISFGRGSLFSGFSITAPNLGFTQFSAPTLFTGPLSAPVFSMGSFTLINPFFGNGRLNISQVQSAVPEPATWAMMLVGFGLTGAAMRHRRRRTSITFA